MDNAIPTDSVLRRHYEATHSKHSNNNQNKPSQNTGGIMSWLKRLFGA